MNSEIVGEKNLPDADNARKEHVDRDQKTEDQLSPNEAKLDLLNLKVGSNIQKGVVKNATARKTAEKYGVIIPKVVLDVQTSSNRFQVDEAWAYDRNQTVKPHDLLLEFDADGNIISSSTLAKMMAFFNVETLQDMIGREVLLLPKPNGYLAIIAVDGLESGGEDPVGASKNFTPPRP